MASNKAEIERLRSQSKIRDEVTEIHYLKGLQDKYIETLYKTPSVDKVKVTVIFDQKTTKELHEEKYSIGLYQNFRGTDVYQRSKKKDSISIIELEKNIGKKTRPYELYDFLNTIEDHRSFPHSVGYSVVAFEKDNEPIPHLSIFSGDQKYEKYFFDIKNIKPFITPKPPFEGRTTIYPGLKHYSGTEEDIVKKYILGIVDIEENTGLRLTLNKECKDTFIAYERFLPPGKELRQHWRMKLHDRYQMVKYYPDVFEHLIINENAVAFYPKLKQKIEFDDEEFELKNRIVIEVDPRASSLDYTGWIFDALSYIVKDKLNLPHTRFHSGSKSPRIHMEIDTESLLNELPDILDNYPYLGRGYNKPLTTTENCYAAIIKGLEDIIYLKLWNHLRRLYYPVTREPKESPKITNNKFNRNKSNALIDFPTSVSIAPGSPKKLAELKERDRDLLKDLYNDKISSNVLNQPFIPQLCTPIFKEEESPKSRKEIFTLCNVVGATEKLNERYKELRIEKLKACHIKNVLEDIGPDERIEFTHMRQKPEEVFRNNYY